ncbi:DUF2256 domain-containing protein [Pseudoalteromonas sp. MMG022]|uniref:DUF2256 domain-containing protein n=1 Tax=Pseudoalteromonas sp. MMG022 TaxID=2909978 RepID=UPI001F364707|nr:DUF2256 domain-containing protein [Pseudoalteromonas sp. MMG022]MCF6433941.1 DUF2256 domain-containing protein [Pseudoalteromonas sp. MMG022]
MNKSQLSVKLCPCCKRPFTWRKKWQKDWPHVKYCSKRCASNKRLIDRDSSNE